MAQTVAGILVEALEQIGVTHIFGLIGDFLNALGDAVRRSKIQSVGVRHEEGGALAAAGQAKLTGRLGVCAGRTGQKIPRVRMPAPRLSLPSCGSASENVHASGDHDEKYRYPHCLRFRK